MSQQKCQLLLEVADLDSIGAQNRKANLSCTDELVFNNKTLLQKTPLNYKKEHHKLPFTTVDKCINRCKIYQTVNIKDVIEESKQVSYENNLQCKKQC